ncbi:MAG: IS3 family transposase [Prevotella sp.]|nr:IS3 family transposase [Prevotella sp.]
MNSLLASHPKESIGSLSSLFGKTRVGYYSVSKEKMKERDLQDTSIVRIVRGIREQAPGIGAYKLFVMLKDVYPEKMMGRDRFYKLMKDRHLMLRPERCRHTTDSNHNYHKYKNLIKDMKVNRPHQLWVADITYIDTDEGVCYLHLITDAFTHEIIGWVLSDSLVAVNTIAALSQAIEQAGDADFSMLTHHSDRGSQYCCNAYIEKLNRIHASISMTEDYKPTDNAVAERVNGIIKQEWLYRMKRPENMAEARRIISDIVHFYNNKRPHISNGMLTPVQMKLKYECTI